jgi:glycosyltransferase involved in cell wall biosynthesis
MRSKAELLKEVQAMLAAVDRSESKSLPIHMVGSDKRVNVKEWLLKLSTVLQADNSSHQSATSYHSIRATASSQPLVSIITSLYRGSEYLDFFLENITSQTIFKDDCELIIINVSPVDQETALIEQYQKRFDNIKLINVPERIGIYHAWNMAIEHSSGEFLTNANVDDVRRLDSLEVQAKHLLDKPDVSVVYSDVFYTFCPNLPFELTAQCGLKTNLPSVNKFNLLRGNSPHNAPMWRRSLHDQIGVFDVSFQSVGDHDFWIRACLEGAKFSKIEDTLISYFFNPKGMSTRQDSPAEVEGFKLVDFYKGFYSNQFFPKEEGAENIVFIPTELFSTPLDSFETDFTVTDSHVFYGPYLKLPVGFYRVTFCFEAEGLGSQRIASAIAFDIAQSQTTIRTKHLGEVERKQLVEGRAELTFANFNPDAEIEFRTHTSGKPFKGKLKFHGVRIEKIVESDREKSK